MSPCFGLAMNCGYFFAHFLPKKVPNTSNLRPILPMYCWDFVIFPLSFLYCYVLQYTQALCTVCTDSLFLFTGLLWAIGKPIPPCTLCVLGPSPTAVEQTS